MLIHAIVLARILTDWYREVYQCPKLFDDILLEGLQGTCRDQSSNRGTTHAQEHLIRLRNIIAGDYKTEPGESTQELPTMVTTMGVINHYLSVSKFPRFWHDAKMTLDTDHGI